VDDEEILGNPDDGPFLDISFPFTNGTLDHESVSTLGHVTRPNHVWAAERTSPNASISASPPYAQLA